MPYAAVEEKLKALPEEYMLMVANYIDSIKNRIEGGKPAGGKGMAVPLFYQVKQK